jgi:hypothetical protein
MTQNLSKWAVEWIPSVTYEYWAVDLTRWVVMFEQRFRETEVCIGSHKIKSVIPDFKSV